MPEQKLYGDENLGYTVLARDLTPLQARDYLEENLRDEIYMQMPEERRIALYKRIEEEGLKLRPEKI